MENRLTYIEDAGRIKYKKSTVLLVKCKCSCGNYVVLRKPHFVNNHTKSCGCLQKEKISKLNKSHGLSNSSTYKSWASMITRCNNKKTVQYKNYGGRGIKVCEEWLDFNNFLKDMGEKPNELMQLDRINNDGDYCKENCKWSTSKENCNNKSNNVKYNFNGQFLSVTEISRLSGINRTRISNWKNRSKYTSEKIELLIKKYSIND
jgi:hypothetical protein